MTIIYAELILTPTDHYVVRPTRRWSWHNLFGDSGLIFALSTTQSQEVRAVIDAHDAACKVIATSYVSKGIASVFTETTVHSILQQDFISGIHLVISEPCPPAPLWSQTVSLVLPTITSISQWDLGSMEDVLTPKPITSAMDEVTSVPESGQPLPWE